jgi:IclR family transcriptional regulator, acetate operon repressor
MPGIFWVNMVLPRDSQTQMSTKTQKRVSDAEPKYPIESVDNALRLLLHFTSNSSIKVAEAARSLEVAPSTAHRLLAMLQLRGFVEQDPATRSYHAGPVLAEIGLAALRDFDIGAVVRPALDALVQQVGETVHFSILRGTSVYFLAGRETDRHLRAGSRVGQTMPAHASASGRAQLAFMPDDLVKELYPSERLPAVGGQAVKTRRDLLKHLETIREVGYATNLGGTEEHVNAVAVAIQDKRGVVRGALTVAAPDVRLPPSEVPRVGRAVAAAAAGVVAVLDGS